MSIETIESIKENTGNSASKAFDQAQQNGSNPAEAIEVSVNAVSNSLNEMGISVQMIDKLVTSIKDTYNEAITNGSSPKEAFEITLKNVNDVIESAKESDFWENNKSSEEISSQVHNSNEFNLDFAFSPNTPQMELLNEAIAKGMSVEEALKHLNNQMFPTETSQQGPPTLAEIQEIESSQKVNIAHEKPKDDQEENKLNQMEADMDAETGNIVNENPIELLPDDKLGTDNTNDNSDKDDDIS